MSRAKWTEVETYVVETVVRPDAVLNSVLEGSVAAGLPTINVSPNHGKLLMLLVRMMGARRVLEIGTLAGYSTIWLGRGVEVVGVGGKVVTLEMDARHAAIARGSARAGLSEVVEVREGKALELLPALVAERGEAFDLIFIDADKAGIPAYFEWALKLSRRGGVIVVDNVVRDGEVVNGASTDASIKGVRRFNEMVAKEPRVSGTVIQTVGSKGYDGFALLMVE